MSSSTQHLLVATAALGAVAWLVGVAVITIGIARARNAGDPDATVARARRMRTVTLALTVPGAILVAAAGGWYVLGRDLSIDPNWWIGTALATWLVTTFGSTFGRARQLSLAADRAGEHGTDDEDAQWRIRRVDLIARGELLLLVVAVVVVVLQPTAPL
ncbi:MAG: hypothetical protein KDC46_12965 [Thermoleophilia bacterium]|nr:hypothetical protein [Thermoleophilia bacterium]